MSADLAEDGKRVDLTGDSFLIPTPNLGSLHKWLENYAVKRDTNNF